MSVYVDDMQLAATVPNGARPVRGRWSHLMADSRSELDAFVARLGLDRSWIQKPGTVWEHYDITAGKRRQALRWGAVAISYAETGHLITCRRHGVPFDLHLLRRDRAAFPALLTRASIKAVAVTPAGSAS